MPSLTQCPQRLVLYRLSISKSWLYFQLYTDSGPIPYDLRRRFLYQRRLVSSNALIAAALILIDAGIFEQST